MNNSSKNGVAENNNTDGDDPLLRIARLEFIPDDCEGVTQKNGECGRSAKVSARGPVICPGSDTSHLSNARAALQADIPPSAFRHGWHPNLTRK